MSNNKQPIEDPQEHLRQIFLQQFKMEEDEYFRVAIAMKRYAGGFFKAIAEAIMKADLFNQKIIKKTWNKEWNEYLVIGTKMMKEENIQDYSLV